MPTRRDFTGISHGRTAAGFNMERMEKDGGRILTRRGFLKLGKIGCVAAVGGAVVARWESVRLETTFRRVEGLGLKERIRVLHLSDFHASWCVPWSLIRESVERGMAEKPDVVVLTGDFISRPTDKLDGYAEVLAALEGHPHCYGSFGNHDGPYDSPWTRTVARDMEELMAGWGVKFLVNRRVEAEIRGQQLRIAGLGDLWWEEANPELCLGQTGESRPPTLLLAHNPDTKVLLEGYGWDVMFCGHTHGGQVVVPFFNWAPVLPVKDRSMVAGMYPWKGRHIHITRGVGNLHGLRFSCRPEVSIVDLT